MAQLPASMRRRRAAITSIHEKPPSPKQKLVNAGGWLLLLVAFVVLGLGIFGLYKVITDAQIAELSIVGTHSTTEQQQLIQHIQPIVKDNYFTSDLEQVRDKALYHVLGPIVFESVYCRVMRLRVGALDDC